MTDKELLEIYLVGFHEELWGITAHPYDDELKQHAYSIGSSHAILGDDISSIDLLSNEEIIKIIRNEKNI